MTIQQTSYDPYQWTITAEEGDVPHYIGHFLCVLSSGAKFLRCTLKNPEIEEEQVKVKLFFDQLETTSLE